MMFLPQRALLMMTARTSTSMAMASARALIIASHHQKQKRQGKKISLKALITYDGYC
jgi:hypothetical protein